MLIMLNEEAILHDVQFNNKFKKKNIKKNYE